MKKDRRKLLYTAAWVAPVITQVTLPAHAQTTAEPVTPRNSDLPEDSPVPARSTQSEPDSLNLIAVELKIVPVLDILQLGTRPKGNKSRVRVHISRALLLGESVSYILTCNRNFHSGELRCFGDTTNPKPITDFFNGGKTVTDGFLLFFRGTQARKPSRIDASNRGVMEVTWYGADGAVIATDEQEFIMV